MNVSHLGCFIQPSVILLVLKHKIKNKSVVQLIPD